MFMITRYVFNQFYYIHQSMKAFIKHENIFTTRNIVFNIASLTSILEKTDVNKIRWHTHK